MPLQAYSYQGDRHNYEHFGAPRSVTAETEIGRYQTVGFVWKVMSLGFSSGVRCLQPIASLLT